MSEVVCLSCAQEVTVRMHAVCCDRCDKWQHKNCKTGATTGISSDEYRLMKKEQQDGRPERKWVCGKCLTGQGVASGDEDEINSTTVPLELPNRRLSESPIRELNVTYVIRDTIDVSTDQSLDISNKDFNRPAAALGVSSPDGRIDVPIPDDGPVTYEIVEGGSQKGGNRLVSSDGYTYTVRRRGGNKVYWTCSVRSKALTCPATVRQMGDFFASGLQGHVHPADPGAGKKTKIRKQVKIMARENLSQSAAEITEQVMMRELSPDDTRMPNMDLVARAANRHRQQHRPKGLPN